MNELNDSFQNGDTTDDENNSNLSDSGNGVNGMAAVGANDDTVADENDSVMTFDAEISIVSNRAHDESASTSIDVAISPKRELEYVHMRANSIELMDELINDESVDPLIGNEAAGRTDNGTDTDDELECTILSGETFPIPFAMDDHGLVKQENDVFSGKTAFKKMVRILYDC